MTESRKFCCCLPVRLGVVIISFLGMGLGGFVAIAGIVQLSKLRGDDILTSKIAYSVQVVVYGIYALICILGLFGAFFKKIGLIRALFSVLIFHLFFSIISGIFALVQLFHDKDLVDDCADKDPNDNVNQDDCKQAVKVLKPVFVVLFIVIWLFEIWGIFIVRSFHKQLEEERAMEPLRKKYGYY